MSRPIVPLEPNARQVGQSGGTVKPKVYLAFGISGAVQHLADEDERGDHRSNTDRGCHLDVAHYGVVADLFDVADELAKLVD